MLAGARLYFGDEHAPVLRRRVLVRERFEEILELALAGLKPFPLGAVDHDRAGEIALGEFTTLAHDALIRVVLDRRPLALAHAFHFSHECLLHPPAPRPGIRGRPPDT